MTTDPHTGLVETLQCFLGDARRIVDQELSRSGPQPPSVLAFARSLAALPACTEAAAAACTAAATAGYLLPEQASAPATPSSAGDTSAHSSSKRTTSRPDASRSAGRPLDADALISTGVAGLLLDRADLDLQAVAQGLAGYLAGPPIDIWDYAIIDASLALDDPVPVVDGWELATASADELRSLLPLPSTADYQPNPPFDPRMYAGLAMLRRVNPNAAPHIGPGPALYWDVLRSIAIRRPAQPLWQPLLALSLYDNPVLQLWVRYRIEPGRRVDRLFDHVYMEPWSFDDTEVELPRTGQFHLDADAVPTLRRFLAELAPLLSAALSTSAKKGPWPGCDAAQSISWLPGNMPTAAKGRCCRSATPTRPCTTSSRSKVSSPARTPTVATSPAGSASAPLCSLARTTSSDRRSRNESAVPTAPAPPISMAAS